MNELQLPLELLEDYSDRKHEVTAEELERRCEKIRSALTLCDLNPKKITAVIGPVITTFQVITDRKMKMSELKNLASDIEYALNIKGVTVKTVSGGFDIEIPNENPSLVPLRDIIGSDEFRNTDYRLPLAIGADVSGKPKIIDLAEAPNILVGGSVWQGKTTALASMILSLMYAKSPEDVRFVMIDPTMMGLTLMFANLSDRYLLDLSGFDEKKAVISDTKIATKILESLCAEMKNRLNDRQGRPDIVVVIDEYGDFAMQGFKRNEIMTSIIRLAQHGKDAGIHLILSTCRPSVDIVTGLIKANFPTRIAFRVTNRIDSSTIIDAPGAERLIGKGDLLYYAGVKTERMQCTFVGLDEIGSATKFIASQTGYRKSYNTPYYLPPVCGTEDGSGNGMAEMQNLDEKFEEAAKLVVTTQQASTSALQVRLGIGYARADKVMKQLEAAGIVGLQKSSRHPQVLIPDIASLEPILKSFRV